MGVKLTGEDGLGELWDVTPEGETMASPHDRGPLTQVGVDVIETSLRCRQRFETITRLSLSFLAPLFCLLFIELRVRPNHLRRWSVSFLTAINFKFHQFNSTKTP